MQNDVTNLENEQNMYIGNVRNFIYNYLTPTIGMTHTCSSMHAFASVRMHVHKYKLLLLNVRTLYRTCFTGEGRTFTVCPSRHRHCDTPVKNFHTQDTAQVGQ
jgi:hypothetical protein